jgi:ribosome-associated protein
MKAKLPKSAPQELLKLVCKALDEKKAVDLRVLRVNEQSSITDYLVLATGTSDPHLRALRVELEKVIDQAKVRIVGMDTTLGSGWLVIDAFDVMVHVFTPETRDKYALENLWKDAEDIDVAGLLVAPKPRKKAAGASTTAKRKSKSSKTGK